MLMFMRTGGRSGNPVTWRMPPIDSPTALKDSGANFEKARAGERTSEQLVEHEDLPSRKRAYGFGGFHWVVLREDARASARGRRPRAARIIILPTSGDERRDAVPLDCPAGAACAQRRLELR